MTAAGSSTKQYQQSVEASKENNDKRKAIADDDDCGVCSTSRVWAGIKFQLYYFLNYLYFFNIYIYIYISIQIYINRVTNDAFLAAPHDYLKVDNR